MNVKENFTRVGKFIAFTLVLLLAGVSSWAQGRVTGKVIDVNGQPLGFVTVVVKGTTIALIRQITEHLPSVMFRATDL